MTKIQMKYKQLCERKQKDREAMRTMARMAMVVLSDHSHDDYLHAVAEDTATLLTHALHRHDWHAIDEHVELIANACSDYKRERDAYNRRNEQDRERTRLGNLNV